LFFYFEIGQSNLGLEDRSYYQSESDVTIAYRHFIRNLALAMSNTTTTIDDDVNEIFEFEKTFAKVIHF
jgi:predicted metalloendopeptidase